MEGRRMMSTQDHSRARCGLSYIHRYESVSIFACEFETRPRGNSSAFQPETPSLPPRQNPTLRNTLSSSVTQYDCLIPPDILHCLRSGKLSNQTARALVLLVGSKSSNSRIFGALVSQVLMSSIQICILAAEAAEGVNMSPPVSSPQYIMVGFPRSLQKSSRCLRTSKYLSLLT